MLTFAPDIGFVEDNDFEITVVPPQGSVSKLIGGVHSGTHSTGAGEPALLVSGGFLADASLADMTESSVSAAENVRHACSKDHLTISLPEALPPVDLTRQPS